MQRPCRRFAWLILAALATLSLAFGAVVAHEGRPVGDYRFIVGWLEEPAYEGFQNAVSLRISKIVDSQEAAAMGVQQEEHGEPGHHDEDPKSTASDSDHHEESGEGEDHHDSEDKDGDGEDHHGSEDSDRQQTGGHHAATIEAAGPMSVAMETSADSVSGLNVQIITEGFTFAPENVNGPMFQARATRISMSTAKRLPGFTLRGIILATSNRASTKSGSRSTPTATRNTLTTAARSRQLPSSPYLNPTAIPMPRNPLRPRARCR